MGFPLRRLRAWISRASTSLPVPFSPVIRTVASVGAILSTVFRMAAIALELPQNIGLSPAGASAFRSSRPIAFRALSRAAVSTSMSLSLSQGFTMKSKAPRFIPSTASWMSAYAVNNTTSTSGIIFLISPAQYRPSFPVLMDVLKFMSSSTTSGRKCSSVLTSVLGEGSVSTSEKCAGNRICNAWRMPALSSTMRIFPFLSVISEAKITKNSPLALSEKDYICSK